MLWGKAIGATTIVVVALASCTYGVYEGGSLVRVDAPDAGELIVFDSTHVAELVTADGDVRIHIPANAAHFANPSEAGGLRVRIASALGPAGVPIYEIAPAVTFSPPASIAIRVPDKVRTTSPGSGFIASGTVLGEDFHAVPVNIGVTDPLTGTVGMLTKTGLFTIGIASAASDAKCPSSVPCMRKCCNEQQPIPAAVGSGDGSTRSSGLRCKGPTSANLTTVQQCVESCTADTAILDCNLPRDIHCEGMGCTCCYRPSGQTCGDAASCTGAAVKLACKASSDCKPQQCCFSPGRNDPSANEPPTSQCGSCLDGIILCRTRDDCPNGEDCLVPHAAVEGGTPCDVRTCGGAPATNFCPPPSLPH